MRQVGAVTTAALVQLRSKNSRQQRAHIALRTANRATKATTLRRYLGARRLAQPGAKMRCDRRPSSTFPLASRLQATSRVAKALALTGARAIRRRFQQLRLVIYLSCNCISM